MKPLAFGQRLEMQILIILLMVLSENEIRLYGNEVLYQLYRTTQGIVTGMIFLKTLGEGVLFKRVVLFPYHIWVLI
jgi:hypothetical protein